MKRSTLAGSVAACICLGLSVPLFAAEPPVAGTATQPISSEEAAWRTVGRMKIRRWLNTLPALVASAVRPLVRRSIVHRRSSAVR